MEKFYIVTNEKFLKEIDDYRKHEEAGSPIGFRQWVVHLVETNEKISEEIFDIDLTALFTWCKDNDKPFYPKLYFNIMANNKLSNSALRSYSNRLCLRQYKNKTFKDSDFSDIKILI